MENMITITREEYERLNKREEWLECLESAGVDNWCGWDYAMDILSGEEVL